MVEEQVETEDSYCLTELGLAFAKWLDENDRGGDFELLVDAFTAGWDARGEKCDGLGVQDG